MGASRKPPIAPVLLVIATISASAAAAAGNLARGEVLFGLCSQCHGTAGGGSELALAPAIAGMGEWYVLAQLENFRSGVRGTHPDDVGGLRMYPMSQMLKKEKDVLDVAAYVASLPATRPAPLLDGGDPSQGAERYVLCATCHGPDGAGNQTLNAPPLRESSDWYLLSSLEKFKAGVRGSNPLYANAIIMRGMATQIPDEQAMKDVIAYIMTLRDAQ